MIDQYDWAGGTEAMLRFGPDTGPVVIAALPLFEEANRTRAFVVSILRALAERGVSSVLPDFPGTGESLVPTAQTNILKMQEAYEGVANCFDDAGRKTYGVSIRSGALLDAYGLLFGRWHFAPQSGADLLRELTRVKQIEIGNARRLEDLWFVDGSTPDDVPDLPVEIAGNAISPNLLTDLMVKTPFAEKGIARRVVRLHSDPAPADAKFEGAPLWRRSEPDNDPALAALLANDIAAWIATCEG